MVAWLSSYPRRTLHRRSTRNLPSFRTTNLARQFQILKSLANLSVHWVLNCVVSIESACVCSLISLIPQDPISGRSWRWGKNRHDCVMFFLSASTLLWLLLPVISFLINRCTFGIKLPIPRDPQTPFRLLLENMGKHVLIRSIDIERLMTPNSVSLRNIAILWALGCINEVILRRRW